MIGRDHASALTGFAQLFECQELERLQEIDSGYDRAGGRRRTQWESAAAMRIESGSQESGGITAWRSFSRGS